MATFSPRTTCPEQSNPYYNRTYNIFAQSGYGMFENNGNCFTGDTKAVTSLGILSLRELVGKDFDVPDINGNWKHATCKHFGKGQIWEVTTGKNVYRCTGNHEWPRYTQNGTFIEWARTSDLRPGQYLRYRCTEDVEHRRSLTSIESVQKTDTVEDVYCIIQPETRSFTLDGDVLTSNCTAYAYGRFSEILGKKASLPTGNAGTWYGQNKSSGAYECGNSPQLGAVACWSYPNAAGHVAVVEKINSDGSILLSESGWGSGLFWTSTRYGPNWYGGAYNFQGFIYNPAVKGLTDTLSSFIKCAQLHVHETNSWVCSKTGITAGSAWSAAFVIAVAKETGDMLGKVLYNSTSATTLITNSILNKYGSVIQSNPEPGDLIILTGYKLGIITDVNKTRLTVIAGDQGNNLTQKFYKETTSKDIMGYYRPNWNASESNVLNLSTYVPLYDELNDRHDATIREVGYLNSSTKPSLSTSNITLSMVNYTTELNSLHKLIYQNSASNVTTDGSAESADVGTLLRYNKSVAEPVKTITIPSSVKQTGIIRNYTNYSYFYSRWAGGTTQRKLADIWASKGKTQSRNIATIDGYYLIAMSSKFGTTGDIVVIELENGDKFKAIFGDSKGSDAGSEWGHLFGSAVDIVEWESIGDAQNGSTKLDLGTWAGQNVVKVYNYGPYLVYSL